MDPATTTGGVDAISTLKAEKAELERTLADLRKQKALKALEVEKLSTDCDGQAQQIKEL